MTYKLTEGDKSVVYNLRCKFKENVNHFSDEHLAETWREFSQSEDYNSEQQDVKFIEWLNYE
jgi:hypothetical protein